MPAAYFIEVSCNFSNLLHYQLLRCIAEHDGIYTLYQTQRQFCTTLRENPAHTVPSLVETSTENNLGTHRTHRQKQRIIPQPHLISLEHLFRLSRRPHERHRIRCEPHLKRNRQIHNSRLQNPAPKLHPLNHHIKTRKHQKQIQNFFMTSKIFLQRYIKPKTYNPLIRIMIKKEIRYFRYRISYCCLTPRVELYPIVLVRYEKYRFPYQS